MCQIAAVIARIRCTMRAMMPDGMWPPCRFKSSWPLRVSLIDSMTCRWCLKNRAPDRGFSTLRAERRSRFLLGPRCLRIRAVVVLVADEDLAVSVDLRLVRGFGAGEDIAEDLAFIGLGSGEGVSERQPMQVQTKCKRSPQRYRLWEAQNPLCAHPAKSERCTVARERAHSTDVESTTQTSSA